MPIQENGMRSFYLIIQLEEFNTRNVPMILYVPYMKKIYFRMLVMHKTQKVFLKLDIKIPMLSN